MDDATTACLQWLHANVVLSRGVPLSKEQLAQLERAVGGDAVRGVRCAVCCFARARCVFARGPWGAMRCVGCGALLAVLRGRAVCSRAGRGAMRCVVRGVLLAVSRARGVRCGAWGAVRCLLFCAARRVFACGPWGDVVRGVRRAVCSRVRVRRAVCRARALQSQRRTHNVAVALATIALAATVRPPPPPLSLSAPLSVGPRPRPRPRSSPRRLSPPPLTCVASRSSRCRRWRTRRWSWLR
jgi:hypothetical protein